MFKLMKYEFRKQLFSKIIILLVLGVLEILFLYGLFAESDRVLGLSIGLFIFLSVAVVLFVSFESVLTFSNDLKTKQSYMLFLTPNSAYKIVGAKVLTTAVTIGLTAAVFVAVTLVDVAAILVKFDDIAKFVEMFQSFFASMFKANIDYAFIITFILTFVLELIEILVIGMSSITLSATFLSNSKLKAVVSVAFFFVINFILNRVSSLFIPARSFTSMSPYYLECLWAVGVVAVFYFLTSYMLDKKVSV